MIDETRKNGKHIFLPEAQLLESLEEKVDEAKLVIVNKVKAEFEDIKKSLQKKQKDFDKIIEINL